MKWGEQMNISIFNKEYLMRRYERDSSPSETVIKIHLHEEEHGSTQWAETQGVVRTLSGHGMVELMEADYENGTRGDRVMYRGRWYECVSCVLYDHTVLSHYNYKFIVVPEDAAETITIFNRAYAENEGYDIYVPTVISGASWVALSSASVQKDGLKGACKYTVRIPEDADFSGKTYVEPHLYSGDGTTFTIAVGDIIVKGNESGSMRPAEVKEKYGSFITITSVSDFRKAPNARHWKVEGE